MRGTRSQCLIRPHKVPRGCGFRSDAPQFRRTNASSRFPDVNERPFAPITIQVLHIIVGFATDFYFLDVISGYMEFPHRSLRLCGDRSSIGEALDDVSHSVMRPDSLSQDWVVWAWRRVGTKRGGLDNLASHLIGDRCGKNLAQRRRARRGRNEGRKSTITTCVPLKTSRNQTSLGTQHHILGRARLPASCPSTFKAARLEPRTTKNGVGRCTMTLSAGRPHRRGKGSFQFSAFSFSHNGGRGRTGCLQLLFR